MSLFFTGGMFSFIGPTTFQVMTFLINLINSLFLLPRPLRHTFDHVMNKELGLGYNHLYRGMLNNQINGYGGETLLGRCYRNCKRALGPERFLVRQLCYLFLSAIPIIGPIIVIFLKAARAGFTRHSRYFQLKGYSRAQTNYLWHKNRHLYFTFGLVALCLEQIPVLNIYLAFTNYTGAALWAVDVERQLASLEFEASMEESFSRKL
ncbi:hypothetical protein OGAPHI_003691 [Ogataea philodendri]|uniref:Uncharacterized protein n=1 Tax=Ogataea philodendri TaxID=1378263 RepID=A0A9P8P5B3_9ASCO|nr:uncharacterized protein OGAPHI_003691 [Ogataea philodendri]KAH3665505.1 hypothetical protein OGAPHI_003691 [Ogataea philodendri]